METVFHDVRNLDSSDRSALERLVGHSLDENQKLIIQVVGGPESNSTGSNGGEGLPDWCNVYEGLTDEEIAEIETAIVRNRSSRSVD